jgi:hypothetical protein
MSDDQQPPTEPVEPSGFIRWLREHMDGETLDELDNGFREAVAAADLSGRKTALTLTIDVDKKGRTIAIKSDVKTKIPPPPREADIFFPDRDGNLYRQDPTIPKLPFGNVVQLDTSEPRNVDRGTGEIKQTGDPQ